MTLVYHYLDSVFRQEGMDGKQPYNWTQDCWLWWAREPQWQRTWPWNIFIYSVTWSEKNTSMYYKRSTSFQENNNQNQFKIYSEEPRRGTTGTIESTQRSINSVQRILGRDWSRLGLGRWLPPWALECFKVSTLNKTISFYFLIDCNSD